MTQRTADPPRLTLLRFRVVTALCFFVGSESATSFYRSTQLGMFLETFPATGSEKARLGAKAINSQTMCFLCFAYMYVKFILYFYSLVFFSPC